jgi:glucosamine--fructose-6-phosphate aminotransferase (isomerizing)
LSITKVAGGIGELRRVASVGSHANIGIGHTRWSTHGKPTVENAHPFLSCDGKIAAVHNGVIENHLELRKMLEDAGHRFTSETDSEVIPHIVEMEMEKGATLEQAFAKLPTMLKGSYAIVLIREGFEGQVAVRKQSPLVIGVGDREYFTSSDIPTFLPYTSKVIYLEENDTVKVDSSGVTRLNEGRAPAGKQSLAPVLVDLHPDSIRKAGFDYFMIKEILEQAEVLGAIIGQDASKIDSLVRDITTSKRVFVVGTGTSYNSSLYADRLSLLLGLNHLRSVVSSELEQFEKLLDEESLVILLSQSGETADTIMAARLAMERDAKLWAIVNSPLSTLGRMCEGVIPISCGPELAVAATKSYTAQLAIVTKVIHGCANQAREGDRILLDARSALYDLMSDASRAHVRRLAEELHEVNDVFLLGRGLQNVTARESALKLKEVGGMRAEAFYTGEMKHGPLALVREGTRAMFFYSPLDKKYAETAASELASRGARIYSFGVEPLNTSMWHIQTDDIGYGLPMIQVVPVQILSYEVAKLRNLNPDQPRNLAKSVTVG